MMAVVRTSAQRMDQKLELQFCILVQTYSHSNGALCCEFGDHRPPIRFLGTISRDPGSSPQDIDKKIKPRRGAYPVFAGPGYIP
jgi:hypothetical protein